MKKKLCNSLIGSLFGGMCLVAHASSPLESNEYLTKFPINEIQNNILNSLTIIAHDGDNYIAQGNLSVSDVQSIRNIAGVVVEKNYALSLNTDSLNFINTASGNADLLVYSELEPYWLRATGINKLPNTAHSVPICVIDSGVDASHSDLPQNMTGYHSAYAGFWNKDALSHGTHITGIIAAKENGKGVKGALSNGAVSLHVSKLIQTANAKNSAISGGSLIESIEICANSGAKIINMSLSGTQFSPMTVKVIDRLSYDRGIIFVGAAGNHGSAAKKRAGLYNDALHYPASYHNVVSVGALNTSGSVASFSPTNGKVDFVAPGTKIISTANRHYSVTEKVTLSNDFGQSTALAFTQIDTGINKPSKNVSLTEQCLFTLSNTDVSELRGHRRLSELTQQAILNSELNCENSGGNVHVVTYPRDNQANLYGLDYLTEFPTVLLHDWPVIDISNVRLTIDSYQSHYLVGAGTSQAAAIISGGIAKLWSQNPQWDREQIIQALRYASHDLGASGKDMVYGYGLPDFSKALTYLRSGQTSHCPSQWYINKGYQGGELVTYAGVIYTANYWSKGSVPVNNSHHWAQSGTCDDSVSDPSHSNGDAFHLMDLTGLESENVEYKCKGLYLGCGG